MVYSNKNSKYEFETRPNKDLIKKFKTGISTINGNFQKVLNKFNLDQLHSFPRKNLVKRILTSTFVDSIIN